MSSERPPVIHGTLYIASNEAKQKETFVQLTSHALSQKKPWQRAHFGVSGLQNYDMIYTSHANIGVLGDFNPAIQKVHEIAKQIILKSATPEEFISVFNTEIKKTFGNWNISGQASKNMLWLKTSKGFLYIKKLFQNELIQIIPPADLSSPDFPKHLPLRLGSFSTVYLSNVSDWILRDSRDHYSTFIDNLKKFDPSKVMFIYSTHTSSGLEQKTTTDFSTFCH